MTKLNKFKAENSEGKLAEQIEEIMTNLKISNLKKGKVTILEKLTEQ
jgi:hypothetical protein